jgi:hypothetical protein
MWENKNSYALDGRQAGISCLRWSAGSKTGFKKGVEFAVGMFQCEQQQVACRQQTEQLAGSTQHANSAKMMPLLGQALDLLEGFKGDNKLHCRKMNILESHTVHFLSIFEPDSS